MKKVKCKICQKRYVYQQEWKTEEEKQVCLTCGVFLKKIKEISMVIEALKEVAKKKGLDIEYKLRLVSLKGKEEGEEVKK
ncbi:MAG: hypothetical protein ABIN00_08200 [candidate division WOR-3 bacterium]